MEKRTVISPWGWFWRMIVLSLPIVGLIMCIIWGFGNNDYEMTFNNYCRLSLILQIIGLVVSIFLIVTGALTGLMLSTQL